MSNYRIRPRVEDIDGNGWKYTSYYVWNDATGEPVSRDFGDREAAETYLNFISGDLFATQDLNPTLEDLGGW